MVDADSARFVLAVGVFGVLAVDAHLDAYGQAVIPLERELADWEFDLDAVGALELVDAWFGLQVLVGEGRGGEGRGECKGQGEAQLGHQ